MYGLCQLSQCTRPDRVFSLLEVDYYAPGNSGLAKIIGGEGKETLVETPPVKIM